MINQTTRKNIDSLRPKERIVTEREEGSIQLKGRIFRYDGLLQGKKIKEKEDKSKSKEIDMLVVFHTIQVV